MADKPEHKDMERVPDTYENEGASEIFDVVDFPTHEDGDEEAPRDANFGDANTRDEDREQEEADREGA